MPTRSRPPFRSPVRTRARRLLAAAAACLALAVPACGTAAQSDGSAMPPADGVTTVGLLLPDAVTGRWEGFDRPLIARQLKHICPECRMEYANARGNVGTQQQQVDTMITEGVDVLVLTPVDFRALSSSVKQAADAGIPVLSYDRLAEGPISGFVSFDGDEVGRLQGEALLAAMDEPPGEARVVMMNGDPTDPNTAAFEEGALAVLEGEVEIAKAYDTPQWSPLNANQNMSGAIAALGPGGIDGVYAANDALASGVIAALKAQNVEPLPPLTGQDAELSAIQDIVEGEQTMTVYKPFGPETLAAAEMALALAHGEPLGALAGATVDTGSAKDVPAVLLNPIPVTADNIEETVVKRGMYTIEEICTPKFVSACERAGLVG
ncbi:sugar ABC transporter substrate-binding protein [Streptomyces sp. RKND-216]|uniref:substrate-binding domain-containing protein n=1 Tax=Streptomyces sp. RKND-216 TaxID=2562581 RepID=UPI00109D971A|nr:substrate-binding domain-containing protein [Streptomyces sp. RKND-216]THA26675.1 sugar ABC transporter substrate-binding protein [Streptomyces sp. RKND-216]